MNLEIKYRPLDELIPYVGNAKQHPDEQVVKIASSIKEFGFNNPILLDGDNGLIAGHGRLLAAKKLGMTDVPTIELSHLSDSQKRAYILADNRLAEVHSDWDMDMLSAELDRLSEDGFDIDLTGFDESFILKDPEEGLTDEDEVPDLPDEPVTVLGDIWVMGEHRLMCGDSTSIDSVDLLMAGKSVDMVFTDPPYNVGFNGRSGKHEVIKNDELADDDFDKFIEEVCQTIKAVDPKVYYVWCNWKFYGALQGRLDYKACIVWAKNVFGLGRGYRHQHEFCLFNGKVDEEIKNESDLWSIKKDSKYVHPTQKPVELSVRAFGNHIKLINVLDLFGGSGSTLIGAEQTRRIAHVMELDEKYCDVIVQRWEQYTGKSASLEATGELYSAVKESREIE